MKTLICVTPDKKKKQKLSALGGTREGEGTSNLCFSELFQKCYPLPEGKYPVLPFQAAESTLNSN